MRKMCLVRRFYHTNSIWCENVTETRSGQTKQNKEQKQWTNKTKTYINILLKKLKETETIF